MYGRHFSHYSAAVAQTICYDSMNVSLASGLLNFRSMAKPTGPAWRLATSLQLFFFSQYELH